MMENPNCLTNDNFVLKLFDNIHKVFSQFIISLFNTPRRLQSVKPFQEFKGCESLR